MLVFFLIMEGKADPDLLVVSLEHCISSDATHLGKRSCIYTTTIPTNSCGHDVLQLATPVQCLGDLNQPLLNQQHLTQFQPIQYPQVQVSYDSGGLEQPNGNLLTDGTSLYQAHPTSAPLNHFNPPSQPPPTHTYHGGYLTSLPVSAPPLQEYTPLLQPAAHETVQEGLIQYTPHTYSPIALTISAIPPSPPKREEQDVEEPEPLPSDDYQYYKEIERFLEANEFPSGSSEYYIRSLKKRAKNYLITEGVLHHSPGAPCRVVMTKEEQDMLLKSYHIIESTGTHIGTKQMFAKLKTKYFWRGMYAGISTYVGKCTACRDTAPIPLSNQKQQNDTISQTCNVSISVQTVCRIWSDVEVQVCGPYKATNNRNSYIAIIVDPESKFLLATALPSSGLSTRLTQFILKSLFSFGFARTHVVVDKELYSAVYEEFCLCTKDLHDYHNLLCRRDKPSCGWVASLLTRLVDIKPFRWDKELEKFLYQFRIGELKQFTDVYGSDGVTTDGIVCPFYSMFQRSPWTLRSVASQDKENSFPIKSAKAHLLKTKQQQENDEIASGKTSSCSLKHNLKDVDEKECPPKINEINLLANNIEIESSEEISEATKVQNLDSTTDDGMRVAIRSIKAFLTETAVYRRRRGRYNKYSDKLRDQMANYALQYGRQKAVKHFSEILGTRINDSTIRNIVKSRAQFGLALRQKIAKFAIENGVAEAAKHYSIYLNRKISHHLIRRFKSLYGPKKSQDKNTTKKLRRNMEDLSVKLKSDIGKYASENTLEDTINYFKNILGISLMESTIYELRRDYLQQCTQSQQLVGSTCSNRPSQNEVGSSSSDRSENFLSQNNFNIPLPEKIVKSCEVSSISKIIGNPSDYQQAQTNLLDNPKTVKVVSQNDELPVELPEETLPSSVEQHLDLSIKQIETITAGKKRGKYASFSPEVRADIGRYAAENGCLKACSHFKSILGRDLPESTVRGIKEQYLKKLKYSEVTSLDYSPRGRAPLLGKYDKMAQDCLKELIKSGEQPSSFLAILTAKKILSKFEPNLLKENGGDIELNVSWAKSFIKRLGVRNKS